MATNRESLNDPARVGANQSRYPSGQAPRTTDVNQIEAVRFLEKDARNKLEQGTRQIGYGTMPKA
jgi:hypothetical protein